MTQEPRKLRELRLEKQLTLRAFARHIGMPIVDLSEIERGKRPATVAERQVLEQEVGSFSVDTFDFDGIGMFPGICPKSNGLKDEIIERGIKNNKELMDFFQQSYEEDCAEKTKSYSFNGRQSDLYQKFISAHKDNNRTDQTLRIDNLKLHFFNLAKTLLNSCPPGEFSDRALEQLEISLDSAIKSIKVESFKTKHFDDD